jgi:DNA invertase Pin-like site-specific DNA recombinase
MRNSDAKDEAMIVGYARVSTGGQELGDQTQALRAAGAARVFSEKMSGARADRPQLKRALAVLEPGDVLLVTRLDRLARSTLDLLATLKTIDERGASFRSLANAWADTTTPHGRLMVTVLGGLAEFERSLIKDRTDQGIARARADGVKFGRPTKLTIYQRREALARKAAGEPQRAIARSFAVDESSISRLR